VTYEMWLDAAFDRDDLVRSIESLGGATDDRGDSNA